MEAARHDQRVTIRPMVIEDIVKVREIDVQSFSMPWSERSYRFELTENLNASNWVAVASEVAKPDMPDGITAGNERVVGMIVVWVILDEAHIATIAVHPDYRSRKIGQKLLARGLLEAYQRGARLAYLEVRRGNTVAQQIYTKFGFEVVGVRPRYYKDNYEDALLMTLETLQPDSLQSYLV